MYKYLFALLFVPFVSFAADSVSIDSITTKPGTSATVSGTAFYDSVANGSVSFDSGSPQTITSEGWSVTQPLKAGQHSVTATVGSASVSQNFGVGSNDNGLICPATQPDCGMPHFFGDLMAAQKPVAQAEKPVSQMSELEITIKILQLKVQVLLLQLQLAGLN